MANRTYIDCKQSNTIQNLQETIVKRSAFLHNGDGEPLWVVRLEACHFEILLILNMLFQHNCMTKKFREFRSNRITWHVLLNFRCRSLGISNHCNSLVVVLEEEELSSIAVLCIWQIQHELIISVWKIGDGTIVVRIHQAFAIDLVYIKVTIWYASKTTMKCG